MSEETARAAEIGAAPTNADRIRGMSDEGLAELLHQANRTMRTSSSDRAVLAWLQQAALTGGAE